MGNLNTSEAASRRGDSSLKALETNDPKKTPKQWNSLSRFNLNGESFWKNLKSGSQSVKSFGTYSKEKKLNDDWQGNSFEELTKMRQDIHAKQVQTIDATRLSGRSKMRRHLRRRRRKIRKDEDLDTRSEMWTLSRRSSPCDAMSLRSSRSLKSNSSSQGPEKMFWRTSRLTVADSQTCQDLDGSQNMLWRSSKHILGLTEDVDSRSVSTIFGGDGRRAWKSDCEADYFETNTRPKRKKRFSRWAFLRHDNPEEQKRTDYHRPKSVSDKPKRSWSLFRDSRKKEAIKQEEESCDCSCCSCNGCQSKEKLLETGSLLLSEGEMAPNSEEDTRVLYQNEKPRKKDGPEKEPQRPPVYNPEDYAQCLKKWGRKANPGMQLPLYVPQSTPSMERISAEITKSIQSKRQSSPSTKSSSSSRNGEEKQTKKEGTLKQEAKNPMTGFKNPIVTVAPQETEMSLRQFASVTELLGKLKLDLRLAFPSFVQEFVGDPVDGVTLLLELLRAVQLSQASQQQRCPPQVLRRALLDEHSCLVCLKHCLRCPDASRRLASSSAGLFSLAVCIMSNVTKSRIIALELLTKACEVPGQGHKPVSEALSTLRLRFGEPVRFRFLVGMLNSAGAVELLNAAMRFINAFVITAPSIQHRVYIQAELEQAGFDSKILRKTLPNHSDSVKAELNKWDKNYFDIETLEMKVTELDSLRDKVHLLEKRIQILQEEKGILQSLEQCLKERCSELEEEVSTKTTTTTTTLTKSTAHIKPFRSYVAQPVHYVSKKSTEKGESTPAEDEGISSSEQELSQDEDCAKVSITYNIPQSCEAIIQKEAIDQKKAIRSTSYPKELIMNNERNLRKMKETNVDDGNEVNVDEDEDETTIDEVIEELRNIVNDAETEVYSQENQMAFGRKQPPAVVKPQPCPKSIDYFEEAEIVPSGLLPQPPRRTKSLVHIFLTGTEYDIGINEFFDEDTDTESSDSLLTASREKRSNHKNCHHRSLEISDSYNSSSSINTRTLFIKQQSDYEDNEDDSRRRFDNTRKMFAEMDQRSMLQSYEKSTSFGVKSTEMGERRPSRFVPAPVKRSQTFHMAIPDAGRQKRPEMKPKPKMGVSGLDLKMKTDYQNAEYKKNSDRNGSDRYVKKMSKDVQQHPLQRRGSLDGLFFVTETPKERLTHVMRTESERRSTRSKSLEKMDDGLDSLVDIVFSQDKPKETTEIKNIGPRTRRSLAESSLFNQPHQKEQKPPQPAQRTSLTRNNSSAIPMHMPVEIKIAPMQSRQSLAMKSAKSESNLLTSQRYPPDGSSSPNEFGRHELRKNESTIYASPSKQSRLQKFFGNPKFEGGGPKPNQKYFESNYACSQPSWEKKSVSPLPRNIQKVKNLISKDPPKLEQPQPKLNFFLGTYHQVHPPKSNFLTGDTSPVSGNSFNNPFLIKRGNAGMYSGTRDGCRSPPVDQNTGRQPMSAVSAKVTDSLSGLY